MFTKSIPKKQPTQAIGEAGDSHTQTLDEHRVYVSTIIFSAIAIPFLLIFAVLDLMQGSVQLGLLLLANAVFAFYMQILTIYKQNSVFIRYSSTLQITFIAVYLVVTGGREGTGILWTFVVPNITYFMVGLKRGAVLTALYLLFIGVFFFASEAQVVYTVTEKIRYMSAYCAVSLFAAGFEYSRVSTLSQLNHVNRRFRVLAVSDPLTQLYNRNGFYHAIEKMMPLLRRDNQYYAVMILDLDRFKAINDQYGHAAGDLVIISVANELMANLRQNDVAARWGGEEYLVFLPATNEEGALRVAERIRKHISDLVIDWKGSTLRVTASIGIAATNTLELEKLILSADKKLYKAKDNNGNCVYT